MDKRNKSTLPGLIISKNSTSSLEGIKNAKGSRGSSALPIMKYFGSVKPSRDERIIKPDMTSSGKVTKQDLPIIREVLQPGFSGNFRTNYTPPSSFDADAVAYFTAVEDAGGILTALEKYLVNTWFVTERAAERLSKYKAVYPFKGKTSGAAAINMVNPGTYDLSFINFVAADFAVSGRIQPDDSTKYADLNFIIGEDISQDDNLIHFQIEEGPTTNGHFWGAREAILGLRNITWYIESSKSTAWLQGGGIGTNFTHTYENKDSFTFNFSTSGPTTSTITPFLNGQALAAPLSRAHANYTPLTSYLFAHHYVSGAYDVASDHIGGIYTAVAFGEGFTDDEASTLNKSFKDISVDPDAQAYIQEVFDQGGTLTLAQQAAVNNLVKSMKADGLWDGAVRLLPFMGGEVDSVSIDLVTRDKMTNVNFVDADCDSKIGLTNDGSTKYLRDISGPSALLASSTSYGLYTVILEDLNTPTASDQFAIGSITGANLLTLYARRFSTQYGGRGLNTAITAYAPTIPLSGESVASNRESSTSLKTYKNGIETASNTTLDTGSLPTDDFGYFVTTNGAGIIANYLNTKVGGMAVWENYTDTDVAKFDRLYKAFIQQVQDSETYDTDAAAYFIAVEDAGGTLSSNQKTAFSNFVQREKAAGRWSKIKRLYPYLGGKINSAIIDAVTTNAATNNNFVDADADATCGLKGDGSTKRLDTALAANIWASTNDWQIYLYEIEAETGDKNGFGAISGGNDMISIRRRNIGSGVSYIYGNNISIAATVAGTFASNQSIYGGRFTSTDLTIYENSNTSTSTTLNTFAFPVTYPISLFARNAASSIQYSNAKVGCHMMAEGMSKADMTGFDTSYKTFINNITT